MKTRLALATIGVALSMTAPAGVTQASVAADSHDPACDAWMDPRDTPEERADALLEQMDLSQKFKLLVYSNQQPWLLYYGTAGHTEPVPELCVPRVVLSDAGSGVAGAQQLTTLFPAGVAQASTWNRDLLRRVGQTIGREAYDKGINLMLAPGMNMARTPFGGRNFEYYGEDPYLTSEMVVPYIKGIQDNPVLANAKHFVINDQETYRNSGSVVADERTLRELYLPPFEAAVKRADIGSIMCAYNKIGPDWACETHETLTDILRKDWGFDGFVLTDWGAAHSNTAAMVKAGTDMEMGSDYTYDAGRLTAALEAGDITEADIDRMVRNIVTPMFRHGLFDRPATQSVDQFLAPVSTPQHVALSRQTAVEATVMLKNRNNLLPLDTDGGRTIAVMGYAATPTGALNAVSGSGSSRMLSLTVVSPLEGIQKAAAAHGDTVIYVPGETPADISLAASVADVVVVVANDIREESKDKEDLNPHPGLCFGSVCSTLPLEQEKMITDAVAANPNTVVVLDIGGPVRMPWLDDAGAVLVPWYGGAEHGNALAGILYGLDEPGGRLPQSFPVDEEQLGYTPDQFPGVMGPDGYEVTTYTEKLLMGYRWYDAKKERPLFPFGYGLSYTSFRYSGLQVRKTGPGQARVTFQVRNTGDRPGSAVPQIYVGSPRAAGEPPKQLKGFEKVTLNPGEKRRVSIDLDPRSFSYWNARTDRWVIAPGTYDVLLGSSSRDINAVSTIAWG